jgi:hypothetical protein
MIKEFDIVIVGSGVGGSSTASRAAENGLKVLIIDIGPRDQPREVREIDVSFVVNGNVKNIKVPAVQGQGGNSSIYGGHLTRFPEHYWNESSLFHIPINPKKIQVYYDELIQKFNINSLKFTKSEEKIKDKFYDSGFTSENILWAVSNQPNCNGCGGTYCLKNCKKDFFNVLCAPLISANRLTYWADSVITNVTSSDHSYSIIKINKSGEEVILLAKCIVFSCGSLATPIEIIRLFGDRLNYDFKKNIGRRMMFHISDFFLIIPKFPVFGKSRSKLLCSSEECFGTDGDHVRYSVQSVGAELSGHTIFRYLKRRYANFLNKYTLLRKPLLVISHFAAIIFSKAHIIATIIEDAPSLKNFQVLNSNPLQIKYNLPQAFIYTCRQINKSIKFKLSSSFFVFQFGGDLNLNFGHALGGMSMGISSTFPVDQDCKVRGLNNIFVCDASILPRSASTNPSLTIASLGYHTADCILKLLKK